MKIIPAIDILNGKCVRLTQGDYNTSKIYATDPLEIAKQFEANGIKYLHVVDLDGARSEHIVNYKSLEAICLKTSLSVDFGGGIKSNKDVSIAFECGAAQITGGSIAVSNPEMFKQWIDEYGSHMIILGADCKSRKIATHGWKEDSEIDVIEFIQEYEKRGITQVICTDISRDGMLQGPAEALYKEILQKTTVQLIASGGVCSMEQLKSLKQLGCSGAIIGKAIYEERISLKEIQSLC